MSAAPLPPTLPRARFTRDQVNRMLSAGVFDGQRFELIDGELIDKMGQKPPHARAVRRILSLLTKMFDGDLISVQSPIEAGPRDRERSQPEPDLAIIAVPNLEHDIRLPRGDELLLVVEVADTSVDCDLSRKADIYAAAGVPEYWVLELNQRRLVAHRQPDSGVYRLVQIFLEGDSVPVAGRGEMRVRDMLPE